MRLKKPDQRMEEIHKLRNQIAEMEIEFNRERGERLVAEAILCAVLFGAGVITGHWLGKP